MNMKPSLFGIHRSNRNFDDPYYWGKNQFNSSFPVALACYMRFKRIPLVYVTFGKNNTPALRDLDVSDLFGTSKSSEDIYFSFESRFDSYKQLVHDELPPIDLVVGIDDPIKQIRPIEVKLTTLPDNTTENLNDDSFGSELVIRSATMRYMALSMSHIVNDNKNRVREIFEPVFSRIRQWDNKSEMLGVAPLAVDALEIFLNEFNNLELPLLMQPIWKTMGKSPILAANCLDIFVWSDFSLAHLFLNSAKNPRDSINISRQLRSALRISRFLYEKSKETKVFQAPIYDGMTFDNQNDKEFAISGTRTREIMKCARLTQPIIHKDEIKNIILGGGQKYLSPERRFDAILYFSTDLF
jgi:hypothetical protein